MKKSTTIVHLTSVHCPYDTRILRRECASLASVEGFNVTLLNAKGINDKFDGVEIVSFARRGSRLSIPNLLIKAYSTAVAMEADLYHLHDPELLPVAFQLQRFGHRVIFDCHEDYFEKAKSREWIPLPLRSVVAQTYRQLASYVMPKLSGIIVAAPHLANRCPNPRTLVLRNFPKASEIRIGTTNAKRQPGLVFYSGGLTPHRGIEQVIEGLIKHCDAQWKLVVVGRSDPGVVSRLGASLNDPRISYVGEVPFGDVIEYMGRASVGVVCNQNRFDYQNALPNKLFEYMAAGLPVVCSDFVQWRELVEAFGAGRCCCSETPSSIGGAIESILNNPNLGNMMGKTGQKIIADELCWERESELLLTFYNSILGRASDQQRIAA